MIAVDTNVLVQAHRRLSERHDAAVRALRGLATGLDAWAVPVFCIGEFLRVVTNPNFLRPPTSLDVALRAVDNLIESPSLKLLTPGDRYWEVLRYVLVDSDVKGNDVFDAMIVAVCIEHGVTTILTEDRGFARFSGISVSKIK